jgi:2-keto-3-deoxy-6-phosphogluconate aldolase
MIKALLGPYSDMMFMLTCGVEWNNLAEYLINIEVHCCLENIL